MNSNETPIKTQRDDNKPQQPEKLIVELGKVIDTNQLPGIPKLFKEVMDKPIPDQRISYLRDNFYPFFSKNEITLIEKMAIFYFKKFGKIADWTHRRDNPKPTIEEYGIHEGSSLQDRLLVVDKLSQNSDTSLAFASLEMVSNYLRLEGHSSLKDELLKQVTDKTKIRVTDVGCGGQAADIQLLLDPSLVDKQISVTGVSAFDYGENIRNAFPEISERISFEQINVYTETLENQSEVVFSVRTLPYTGMIDSIRFLRALHDMATNDGVIWMEGVTRGSFDFSETDFDNLSDFFNSLKNRFPSLKFSTEKSDYIIHWDKSGGFPFQDFVAKEIIYNDSGLPYMIRYKIKSD